MTTTIDWTKPVEVCINSKWYPIRVLALDREGIYPIAFDIVGAPSSTPYTCTKDGEPFNLGRSTRLRNIPPPPPKPRHHAEIAAKWMSDVSLTALHSSSNYTSWVTNSSPSWNPLIAYRLLDKAGNIVMESRPYYE